MMEKFQLQLVKVRSIQEARLLKNNVINIENSDDVSSINTNHTLSHDSRANTGEHSCNTAEQDWKMLQEKIACDTEKLREGEK